MFQHRTRFSKEIRVKFSSIQPHIWSWAFRWAHLSFRHEEGNSLQSPQHVVPIVIWVRSSFFQKKVAKVASRQTRLKIWPWLLMLNTSENPLPFMYLSPTSTHCPKHALLRGLPGTLVQQSGFPCPTQGIQQWPAVPHAMQSSGYQGKAKKGIKQRKPYWKQGQASKCWYNEC